MWPCSSFLSGSFGTSETLIKIKTDQAFSKQTALGKAIRSNSRFQYYRKKNTIDTQLAAGDGISILYLEIKKGTFSQLK